MHALAGISSTDFEAVLTPAELRISQAIQGAMGAGVMALFMVVVVLYMITEVQIPATGEAAQFIKLMSLINVIVAISIYGVSTLVERAQFKTARLGEHLKHGSRDAQGDMLDDTARQCLYIIRSATIIRLAMYDAIALFGIVVCILAVLNGVLQTYPIYWLNALSSVLMVAYVIVTFPTTDRLKTTFQSKMKSALV